MAERTKIPWADATWNPWQGCFKVSPGCAHCYMFREKIQFGQNPELVHRSITTWGHPLRWAKELQEGLKPQPSRPNRVFVCSWSDFFLSEADEWRREAWDIIYSTPELIYLILTKRPENIPSRLPFDWGKGWSHVWLGVSVENQYWAEKRIPILLQIPAAKRFISVEPLLGPISLQGVLEICEPCFARTGEPYVCNANWDCKPIKPISLVIVGGESGPQHRPMNLEWVRMIREQCRNAGVAYFGKQMSAIRPGVVLPGELGDREWPTGE